MHFLATLSIGSKNSFDSDNTKSYQIEKHILKFLYAIKVFNYSCINLLIVLGRYLVDLTFFYLPISNMCSLLLYLFCSVLIEYNCTF